MSDIGVHSNVYQRVREYGQLIDDVILGLRSKSTSTVDPSRQKLGELLISLAAAAPPDPRSAWLGMLIGGTDLDARTDWARVGRALLSPDVDAKAIEKLEDLAQYLEERRTEAMTRMRGLSA
jgi:hypothetical protein